MYILECADGSYYTGSTWDLERRLYEHQTGIGANHTAKRLPVKLVYCEYCDRVEDAYRLEKQVQGWSRRKKQALIEQNYEKLVEYSRNYTQYPPLASTRSVSTGSTDALPELVEGSGPNQKSVSTSSTDALPERVEGSGPNQKSVSTGSTDALPERVEGSGPNRKSASIGSVDGVSTGSTDAKQAVGFDKLSQRGSLPEPVEGSEPHLKELGHICLPRLPEHSERRDGGVMRLKGVGSDG